MSESLADLADEVARLEERVADAVYAALRAQLHEGDGDAPALERRLARVRRSLAKAEALLRGED
ncbi:MAG: hypothetical protein ACRDV0_08650 [Acidimicrobiales bacterium]